jgi:alkylation response protein AidB-like acyl-CoA dehydrogenase
MDFNLSQSQEEIKGISREFATKIVAPRAKEIERTGEHPYDILSQMAKLGMMGIPFPKRYGGTGGDWVSQHLCIEELSRAEVLLGAILDVDVCIVGQELFAFGTEEQKQKWLIPIAQGEKLGAFGLTESDAGSDAEALRTTAILRGDEWLINGSKQFITNTGLDNSSIVIIAAKTQMESDRKTMISTIIVPDDAPGFRVGQKYEKMASRASATHELFFDDCRVPRDFLLGDLKKGFAQHLSVLQTGRIAIAAMATGVAQACFDEALSFTKKRFQGPQSFLKSQRIPFKLADIAMRIELSRIMYLKAAWLKDVGKNHTLEAHFAKLYASETATWVAAEVLKIFSPYGCLDEYPISRYFKQTKLLEIVEGTSEMQRLVIARKLYS